MLGSFRFDRFSLDPGNRQLRRDDAPVELNSRYLDALALLVREHGKLVSKERFHAEVWRGAPVTDEALTQCIKSLRKQLGDDAGRPRFIETVPKHGYRFIAPVERVDAAATPRAPSPAASAARPPPAAALPDSWREFFLLGGAGVLGGGAAGMLGGLLYGFAGAPEALQPGMGAISVLLVLVCVSVLIGSLAGGGVGFGVAAAGFASKHFSQWSMFGGAAGGLIVGAVVKLIGLDAFTLFLGQSPGDITGAAEGALLGGAIGFGLWLGSRTGVRVLRRSVIAGGVAGAAAGVLVSVLGGRLMGGSLELLAEHFPTSRLELGQIGGWFGESGFGPLTQTATSGLEGAVFAVCMVGALTLARQRLSRRSE